MKTAIAFDLVNSSRQNLVDFTNPFRDAFDSPADGFQIYQRGVSPSIPFAVLDDSLSIFPADDQGIIGEANQDRFFGVADTVNSQNATGDTTASWVFDISNGNNLQLAIDMGAMGDFEDSDIFTWTYQIDGGSEQVAFQNSVDTSGSFTYTMDDGKTVSLNDPMQLNGTTLTNDLQTFTTDIDGTGSQLTLTLTANTNGGDEAFAFQNIVISENGGSAATDPVMNEFVFNHTGSDNQEYLEIAGDANTNYANFSLLSVEGDSNVAGTVDSVFSVGTTDANGLWETGFLSNELENGSNSLLLVENFAGNVGDDLDTDNDGVLETTPWERVVDSVAVDDGGSSDRTYANVTLAANFDGLSSFPPGGASRLPNATDTDSIADWVRNDFDLAGINGGTPELGEAFNTPGELNAAIDETSLPKSLAIYDIQGEGHNSPFVGEAIVTSGIVTAVDSNGFYLQDATGDGNENTSDGIFVFSGSSPGVSLGDELEVQATVTEFIPGGVDTGNLSITELVNPSLETLSTGNPLPDAVVLAEGNRLPPKQVIDNDNFAEFDPQEDGIDFYESLEGMRVTVNNAIAVSPTNRFGEIFTVAENGEGENTSGLSQRGTINISPDDFNPERIQIQLDSDILPNFSPQVNVGSQLGNVTGVVGYNFGNFEVVATETFSPVASHLTPESSELQSSDQQLTVASYNLLNLDPTVEDPNLTEDGFGDVDDDIAAGRFAAIASQIANQLNAPDIVALQEIQDNNGAEISDVTSADATLQRLVDEIAAAGGGEYEFIDNPFIGNETNGGQPGGNIRNAFLYKPDRVRFVEGSLTSIVDPQDQQTNPDNPFFDSRLPLSAEFRFGEETVTVVNNHFSSKGGSSPLFGQNQPTVTNESNTGQEDPNINGSLDERRDQATAVKEYTDGILAENPDANVVVLGDLNEFEFISPVADILGENLTNLTDALDGNEGYSFIFQGNSQSLDHILVSDGLQNTAQLDIVHTNTEFADAASDHDPLLAGLLFGKMEEEAEGEGESNSGDSLAGDLELSEETADWLTSFSEESEEAVSLSTFLENLGYEGENPVADGYLQLTEMEGGTLLAMDADGFGDAYESQPLAFFAELSLEELQFGF
ncbi:endonuclease/exonuclease/phosphatase family protein [Geitlerinema sp. PCC 9228]|uniref:endonuclease/exonuclease/phosphatase family protein n=1 Tax=Geitlerinema sp. PCC 9228 TaxID=111611 RepID=UPI0008F9C841|nr:endonuclease/exonuclease/phosphatase family protein [Geitlerinema sp. PCC 9228]